MKRANTSLLARPFVALCMSATLALAGCGDGCGGDPPGVDGGQDANNITDPDGGSPDAGDADAGTEDAGPQPPTEPIRDPNPNDPNNANLDSDCDGLTDLEEYTRTWAGGLRTDPANWDSDGDGIADGIEAGRTAPIDPDCPATWIDADPTTTTNPTVADSDGDCIPDGLEDKNRNGRVDPGETDPNNPDSDGDGIPDGEEDQSCNGVVDPGETNPAAADSDGDGLNDGVELSLGLDPTNPDSDGDGIPDGIDPDPTTPTPDADGDGIADDLELLHGTDPNDPDSDGDGLCDGPNTVPGVCVGGEDLNGNGLLDPGETDPLEPDSDCDGLSDSRERILGTNPRAPDTDGDLIWDGVEVGNTTPVPGSSCPTPPFDLDPSTTTDPLDVDTDGDGLNDGIEDRNRNGRFDPPGPGHDPRLTPQETDPTNPDTDGDGLCDGPGDLGGVPCVAGEDRNRNGRVDGGETDPNTPDVDSDGDGLNDSVELIYCSGPGNCLNPNNPDTDGDGLSDGDEIFIYNTDPLSPDTDCDGVSDGDEVNVYNTNPLAWDTDGDGLSDGVELGKAVNIGGARCIGIFVADADPSTTTDPNNPDSDGDGVIDGAEDGNQNGRVDPGELNPNDAGDALPGTPVSDACANPILPNLHQQQAADALLATHPSFPLASAGVIRANGQVVGLTTVDPTNGILAFAVRMSPEGAGALAQLQTITGRIGGTTVPLEQPFTTWDGFAAARGTYNCGSGCQDGGGQGITTRAERLVRRILNRGATDASVEVPFLNPPAFTGPVKLGLQVVRRSPSTAIVVGAITSQAAYDDPSTGRDFRLEDIYGGSALAQVGDTIGTECDRFIGQQNQKVDFIWIVDDSGSMTAQQQAVEDAANAMAAQLQNSTLDWRIGVVTTHYWTSQSGSGNGRTYCDFMTTATAFQSCMDQIVASGRGDERGWQSLQRIFADRWLSGGPTPAGQPAQANRVRADAQVVVVVLADSGDQSRNADGTGGRAAEDVAGWTAWAQGGAGTYTWDPTRNDEPPLILNGIICPFSAVSTNGCKDEEDSTRLPNTHENYSWNVYNDVIVALGGVIGSISVPNGSSSAPANEIQATVAAIMNVVAGQVAPYELSDDPISATVKVAIGAKDPTVPGVCPNLADLPRSRQNGFSYDAATNQIAFWGSCRPQVGTDIAVSYRTWIDLTADPDGGDQPCGGDCAPPFVCINDQCVCPSDCGGNLGPGQTCNPATCQPECLDDCGGACGNGQVCNTGTCQCECDCANDPAPPPGYPSNFVCDLGTCQWSCPANGCDPATRPAGGNWVCGADCTWTCPDDCGDPNIAPTERCNKQTCQVECAADCNASCGLFEACNTDTCACECVENATCAPGFVFDPAACGCVCDVDALACPATHVPDLDSCSCACGDNCNDSCGPGTLCNPNTCGCVSIGG